jgi:hypothetical protein
MIWNGACATGMIYVVLLVRWTLDDVSGALARAIRSALSAAVDSFHESQRGSRPGGRTKRMSSGHGRDTGDRHEP